MDGNIEKMQSLTGRIKGLGIDKTLTKKGMCAEAEATGKALATKVSITDIVDDLLSVATDKPLSANQGRLLKKLIDEIDPHYAENVLYKDTNVKDALDKVSKAENIAYDGDKSVQGAIDEVKRTLGYTVSKNLLPHPYHSLTVAENGVKWADDGEGRVTANGTTTTLDSYMQCARYSLFLPSGTYILNGCPNGGSNNTYFIVANYAENDIRYDVGYDYGEGVQFTLDEGRWLSCDVVVKQGQTVNNLVFKPMISKEGGEFEPYVTDVNTRLQHYDYLDITSKINKSSNCHSLISAYVKNGFVHIKGVINESAVLGQNTWLFGINDAKYRPSETMYGNIIYRSSADLNKVLDVRIESSGTCYVWLLNDLAAHTYFSLMYPIN
jgi:hypothetical protein